MHGAVVLALLCCRLPFFRQIVPTVDMVRYQFLMSSLINSEKPVLLVGPVGTGKTSVAESTLGRLDSKSYSVLSVNMSAQVRFRKAVLFENRSFGPSPTMG